MKNIFTFLMIFFGLFTTQVKGQVDTLEVVEGVCNEDYLLSLNGQLMDAVGTCAYGLNSSDVVPGTNEVTIGDSDDFQNALGGITTLDLVLAFRGLLGEFEENFQVIASDFDADGVVTTMDLVSMRRLILGLDMSGLYEQHKILGINHVFPADFGPFNLGSDFKTYTFDSGDLGGENLGVRIIKGGDLNDSFFQSEELPINRDAATLSFQERSIEAGETYNIVFDLNATSGFQASTFELVVDGLKILSFDENENNFMHNTNDATSKLSFISDHPENSVSFSMEFEATIDGMLSDMLSLNEDFLKEIVDFDGNLGGVNLAANVVSAVDEFSQEQFTISPNPVAEILNISFNNYGSLSPKNIELISLDGKTVINYQTFDDVFSIEVETLPTNGLHLIRVTQDGKTKVDKVFIK